MKNIALIVINTFVNCIDLNNRIAKQIPATRALLGFMAHELNQPLGASNLDIQFLQKKLSEKYNSWGQIFIKWHT